MSVLVAAMALIIPPATAQQGYSTDNPRGRYGTRDEAQDEYRGNTQNSRCRQLESELASDWVRGQSSENLIPDLNRKIQLQENLHNKLQNDADRMNCYEDAFIFGQTLRRTKKCLEIDSRIRDAKRDLVNLREERASIRDSRTEGNRRNRLIEELARNNCGDQYRYEAQRSRSSGSWFDNSGLGEFFGIPEQPRSRPSTQPPDQIQPYATYRTVCVRLCDGFFYPISFSTLPSSFPMDADACHNGCAAPAELYVYRNPGGEAEQMIAPDGRPYSALVNAWRFRKEYVKGCSCKVAEYSEADIAAHENAASGGKTGAEPAPSAPAAPPPAEQHSAAPADAAPAIAKEAPQRADDMGDFFR